jgi:hypothetical protein
MSRQRFFASTTLAEINKQTIGRQPRQCQSWRARSIIFIVLVFLLFLNLKVDKLLNSTLCITGSDTVLSSILFESR